MHLTAPPLRLLGVLILCLVIPASADVRAQTPAQTEADLKAQITQRPDQPSGYLALAMMYLEQGRLKEAEQMITNALALTRRLTATQPAPAGQATPSAPIRIGGSIGEPTKIKDVRPVYPEEARDAGISGLVILEAVIDREGRVRETRVVRSVPGLDEAAEQAVGQWEYTPTLLGGQAVEVIMTVTVNFRLGG